MSTSTVSQRTAIPPQCAGYVAPDAEITAEPRHGGVVLTITRRKTRRIWVSLDELPRVLDALQAHCAPVTVHHTDERG